MVARRRDREIVCSPEGLDLGLEYNSCDQEPDQRTVRLVENKVRPPGLWPGGRPDPAQRLINNIGSAVRPEPRIGRPVEPGRIGGADQSLIAQPASLRAKF